MYLKKGCALQQLEIVKCVPNAKQNDNIGSLIWPESVVEFGTIIIAASCVFNSVDSSKWADAVNKNKLH